ncbi:MAG: SpoIIE family protein phosphatase, partial [Proteobacteria bacterium]|nr:SpoIIE family protein phosphatase [Pseudomonadota bacterium]
RSPSLVFVALINIGSVVNTIKKVSGIIKEKTKIDRDIEIGKELQSGILPQKKFRHQHFSWHAFYYPASHLAGDWFDLQEVTSKDKRHVLLACIVDVTGHGISSAMMTSNIASHWGLWSESLQDIEFGQDHETRNDILRVAPHQIHRGLVGLRYNLGCSMAVIMYEPATALLTYLTAGHPGIMLSSGSGDSTRFQYLTSVGTRPGITNGVYSWQAKTIELDNTPKTIALFTDGIVEEKLTVPTWLKHVKRKAKKGQKTPTYFMLSQLRKNRKLFLAHPDKEDDLTLLVINLSKPESAS